MQRPLPADTRGIIDPAEMMRHVDFDRSPAGDVLDGLVEWFWSVAWDMPDGVVHEQEVLNHPAGNISIGTLDDDGIPLDPPRGRVYGVMTGRSNRRLTVAGWTVAARTTVGGLGVLMGAPARTATDVQFTLTDGLPGLDESHVLRAVCAEPDNASRVAVLRSALSALVSSRDPALIEEARQVGRIAAMAERDQSVVRVAQLAEASGTSVRTLQRLFDVHVGVSPSFVIRRWRIIEAADAARSAIDRGEDWRGWATVASELGYADQAHLTRDFRQHLGTSPSAYLALATRSGG
ncbi:MAG: helix-turn-helix transcriptional regulator [Acidimicrobiia bacterium]|nr:helix-turn-helix transcriptional regulator [Acidimicrobiia bacterium]